MSSHEREITFAEPLLTAPCAELAHQAALIREEAVAVAHNVLQEPALLVLGHRIRPAGEVVVDLGGELDIVSAETAVSYVSSVIDRYRGPVVVDLAALAFCDARGLRALLRMAGCAERAGCPFGLASPRPSLLKLIRITGLDRRFLISGICPADCLS